MRSSAREQSILRSQKRQLIVFVFCTSTVLVQFVLAFATKCSCCYETFFGWMQKAYVCFFTFRLALSLALQNKINFIWNGGLIYDFDLIVNYDKLMSDQRRLIVRYFYLRLATEVLASSITWYKSLGWRNNKTGRLQPRSFCRTEPFPVNCLDCLGLTIQASRSHFEIYSLTTA